MELWPCAEMVGIAQQAFDISLNYAKTRVQFGRPIGSFQAIKHKLANMVLDVDGSRYVTYHAAWLLSEGLPAAEIAVAKAWTNEACRRVVKEGQQVHGGIGYTKEVTCSSIRDEPRQLKSPSMTRHPPRGGGHFLGPLGQAAAERYGREHTSEPPCGDTWSHSSRP